MLNIIDGKSLSKEIFEELKESLTKIKFEIGRVPKLAIVIVGDDIASHTYVANKIKACKLIGIESRLISFSKSKMIKEFSSTISSNTEDFHKYDLKHLTIEERLEEEIYKLNEDKNIDGIIIQLPLPNVVNVDHIINCINPKKDVDGVHPFNLGKMSLGLSSHIPATPLGILEMIKRNKIPTSGKKCVIVGRSRIVGLPLSILLAQNKYPGNCSVTLCHSYTNDLEQITSSADILVAAMGKPKFITSDMVKQGAVVLDVGTNRVKDNTKKRGYRLEGDVDFENVSKKCSYITPVPYGIGPMTIAALMMNTIKAASYNFDGI